MRCAYLLFLGLLLPHVNGCPIGEVKSGKKCVDYDECEYEDLICRNNAVCYNTYGSYYCQCETGYQQQSGNVNFTQDNSKGCKDFNECTQLDNICGPNSVCNNTDGSYYCTCQYGFFPSNGGEIFNGSQGVTCNDRNECVDDLEICGQHAKCNNTVGGYYCTCDPGYRLPSGQTNFTSNGRCEQTNYGFLMKKMSRLDPEQFIPELESIKEELKNCTKFRDQNMSTMTGRMQVDAISVLEAFLNALDRRLSAGPIPSRKNVTSVLEITENVLKLLGPSLPNITKSTVHTELNMLVRRDKASPDGPFILSTNETQLESHWETAAGDSYLGFAAASLLSYKVLESSVNNYFEHIRTHESETFKINSKVVTAAVTNSDTAHLKKKIILTFSNLQSSDRTQTCVFWNTTLDEGAWSTEGCSVVSSNGSHTVCSCTHLSSFAVLMALHEMEDVFELQLITWVGLSLSIICLLICMLTFRFIRSIQSTRTTIHLHLCISLFIADLVFLAGITQTENEVACAFVAGLLHFFFLAAFCWMCLEGVQLFRMVVLVFNTTLRPLYLMAGGYGIPALIVIMSASINAKGYGTKSHCWLNLKDGFIWSFFGPVCVIIVVNIFFFLITVWKLAQKFSSLNQDLNNLDKIKSFTVTAIAQLCVLGTMWIFGCFQFEGKSLVMSYLFTIFNSLQGVLVFVMHCLLSRQVREEYAKILPSICAPEKKKYSEFSTNQSSKSQTSRSVQHTGESHI